MVNPGVDVNSSSWMRLSRDCIKQANELFPPGNSSLPHLTGSVSLLPTPGAEDVVFRAFEFSDPL